MRIFQSREKKNRVRNLLTLVLSAALIPVNGQPVGMTSEAIMESNRNLMMKRHHLPASKPEPVTPAGQPYQPPVEIIRRSSAEMSYSSALDKFLDMKEGKQPFSLKEAVFTIENAWFENKLDFEAFDNALKEYVAFIMAAIREAGLDPDEASARHYMLFQFMSDTISIKHPYGEGVLTHYTFPV